MKWSQLNKEKSKPIASSLKRTTYLRNIYLNSPRKKKEDSEEYCEQLYASKLDNLYKVDNS